MRRLLQGLGFLAILFSPLVARAEPDSFYLGDGHGGVLTVNVGTTTTVNTYDQVSANVVAGALTVSLASNPPATWVAGDLILLWESGGLTNPGSGVQTNIDLSASATGRWELGRLASKTATSITFSKPISKAFSASVTQAIRVPEYKSVSINGTVTAPAFDGATGGVVAFLVCSSTTNAACTAGNGTIAMMGVGSRILANGVGFRPGLKSQGGPSSGCTGLDEPSPQGAAKGEGTTGFGGTGYGNRADGAGGGVCTHSGGGGGGNGGPGGNGGFSADGNRDVGGRGGAELDYSLGDHFTFGGGGGAGHQSNSSGSASGASGGGVIWVRAVTLTGTGSLTANGANAPGTAGDNDPGGGGGAGGAIYARFLATAACSSFQAIGGNGGSTNLAVSSGAGGGGGHVLLQASSSTCSTAGAVNTGVAGTATTTSTATPQTSTNPAFVGTNNSAGFPGPYAAPISPAPVVTFPANGSSITQPNLTLMGTSDVTVAAGTTVHVYVDGVEACTATVQQPAVPALNGSTTVNWFCTPAIAPALGSHTASANYESPTLTFSAQSAGNTFTMATTTFAAVYGLEADSLGDRVAVRWSTDLELDSSYFRVLRADGGDPVAIGALVATGSFSDYELVDANAPNASATYYVEEVDLAGGITRYGPVSVGAASSTDESHADATGSLNATGPVLASNPQWSDPSAAGDVRILSEDADGITYEILPPPLEYYAIQDAPPIYVLRMSGYGPFGLPGAPDVPARAIRVPLPAFSAATATILSVDDESLPAIEPNAYAGSVATVAEFVPAAFEGGPRLQVPRLGETFPAAPVSLVDAGRMGDREIVHLVVAPARWQAETQRLLVAHRIVVRVAFRAAAAPAPEAALDAATSRQFAIVSGESVRVDVDHVGVVRVPAAALAPIGAADSLAVYRNGFAIPSQAIDGALLFYAPRPSSPLSARETYWIAPRSGPALSFGGSSTAPASGAVSTVGHDRVYETDSFVTYLTDQGSGYDRWFWTSVMNGQTRAVPLDVSGAPDTAAPATLTLSLRGLYQDPLASGTAITVRWNGTDLGTVPVPALGPALRVLALPAGATLPGQNVLEISDASSAVAWIALDRAELSWDGPADLGGAGQQEIRTLGDGAVTVGGFVEEPAFAIDVTDATPILLAISTAPDGLGGWTATADAPSGRRIVFSTPGGAAPASIAARPAGAALRAGDGADYLAIAPRALLAGAEGFAEYRHTPAGGNFRARAIAVEDIYDQFSFGDPDPSAIRRFLARAGREWPAPAPRYLLLLGDSTMDPKGNLGPAGSPLLAEKVDAAPLWVVSDTRTAAWQGDDILPDLAIGRIPARNAEEAAAALAKTKGYEAAPRDGWHAREVLLAGEGSVDFDRTTGEIASLLPPDLRAARFSATESGDAAARTSLMDELARGDALATYVGHGNVETWGAHPYLESADAASLSNARLPIVVAVDCLNAWLDHPNYESLSEALVRAPNGAVAVWSSSAITNAAGHHDLAVAFHHAFWREPMTRLGDIANEALAGVSWRGDSRELLSTFVLLGDPALRVNVNRPPVAAARLVSVDGLTARVSAAQSYDADGDALAFRWEVVSTPEGATAQIEPATGATPRLAASLPGRYRLRLLAADASLAGPADDLVIDLGAPATGEHAGGCNVTTAGEASPGLALLGLAVALAALVAASRYRRASSVRPSVLRSAK